MSPTFDALLAELSDARPASIAELLPAHALEALALLHLIDPEAATAQERRIASVADVVLAGLEAW